MNIIDEVEQFKRELRSYAYWKKKVAQIEEDLEAVAVRMRGLSSPQFDRIPGEPKVSGAKSDHWYALMEKEEDLQRRKDDLLREIRFVERVLNNMDEHDAAIIRRVYIERQSYQEVAQAVGYSESGIYYRIRKAIKSAVTSMEEDERMVP